MRVKRNLSFHFWLFYEFLSSRNFGLVYISIAGKMKEKYFTFTQSVCGKVKDDHSIILFAPFKLLVCCCDWCCCISYRALLWIQTYSITFEFILGRWIHVKIIECEQAKHITTRGRYCFTGKKQGNI